MIFKERAFACGQCGTSVKALLWDAQVPPPCACGGPWEREDVSWGRNYGVIDDAIEGGPRVIEFGEDAHYVESKSEWRRVLASKPNLMHVDRHDHAYYARHRKQHDEWLRDTGQK